MRQAFGPWFRVLALLALCATWAGTARAEGAEPFEPVDAQALIDTCWAISKEQRDSGVPAQVRLGKIKRVRCLKETLLEQLNVLIDGYVALEYRDGGNVEELRRAWNKHYSALAEEESCYPSCSAIEKSRDLDWDARIGEAIVRDYVAARNLYQFSGEEPVPGDRPGVFSEPADAEALIKKCWDISQEMRDAGVTGLARYGTSRTARCLKEVILDLVPVLFPNGGLTREQARKKLNDLGFAVQTLYWKIYNGHRGCDPSCGTIRHPFHLAENATILEQMIRVMIDQRKEYRF